MIDEGLGDTVRVTVIATGFEGIPSASPAFETPRKRERDADTTGTRPLERATRDLVEEDEPQRRDPVMDEGQRSSLEIPDDDIDIPSFLKD